MWSSVRSVCSGICTTCSWSSDPHTKCAAPGKHTFSSCITTSHILFPFFYKLCFFFKQFSGRTYNIFPKPKPIGLLSVSTVCWSSDLHVEGQCDVVVDLELQYKNVSVRQVCHNPPLLCYETTERQVCFKKKLTGLGTFDLIFHLVMCFSLVASRSGANQEGNLTTLHNHSKHCLINVNFFYIHY